MSVTLAENTTSHTGKQRPIDRMLALFPEAKQHGEWFNAQCPAHNDSNASFGFIEHETGGVGVHCFAGCTPEKIVAALNLTMDDLRGKGSIARKKEARTITLWDLAVDKCIHPNVLASFGLTDGYLWKGKKVIRIPYYLENGEEHTFWHVRTNLIAKEGTFGDGTGGLIPYGLNRLADARNAGYLVIVEGESDCWTNWRFNLPTLGIPGADNEKTVHADKLQDIDHIYISQEMTDPAGRAFPGKVARRLAETGYTGTCYAMPLMNTHEAKDPNALLQKLYREGRINDFPAEMQKAMDAALPVELEGKEEEEELKITLEGVQPDVLDAIEKQDASTLYDLAEKIAAIEDTKGQVLLTDSIKSGMKRHPSFSWASFKKLWQEAKSKREHAKRQKDFYVSGKTQILLGRQLREEIDDSFSALYKRNFPPEIYRRAGKLVCIHINEKGTPEIEQMTATMLMERLTRAADYQTYNEAKGTYSSAHPTLKIAQGILDATSWQFPALEGITELPVLRADGTILDTPGYDPQTHLCYMPSPGMQHCKIPLHPTRREREKAKDLIEYTLSGFPFEAQADKANMIALLLTPLLRSALSGDVQLALIDGNKPGTGKGYLTHYVSVIATGKLSSPMNIPAYRGKVNDEELEKRLGAKLLAGAQMAVFDNVACKIESQFLELVLASGGEQSMRPLGQSKMMPVSTRAVWIVNGNNLEIGGDLARRCYRIRILSPIGNPEERDDYNIKDFLAWIQEHRAELVTALFTLIRAWYDDGKPQDTHLLNLASFTPWANMVGGILYQAGIEGFQQNRAALKAETNQEEAQWENFLTAWQEWQHSRGVNWTGPKKLAEKIIADRDFAVIDPDFAVIDPDFAVIKNSITATKSLFEALPETLKLRLADKPNTFDYTLKNELRRRVKTPYGQSNIRIEPQTNPHTKNKEYSVVAVIAVINVNATHSENKLFLPENEMCKNNIFAYGGESKTSPLSPHITANPLATPTGEYIQTVSTGHSTPISDVAVIEDVAVIKNSITANPHHETRLAALEQKMLAQVGKTSISPFWKEITGQPDAWKNGSLPVSEWMNRLRQCLHSENTLLVNNALDVLEEKGV